MTTTTAMTEDLTLTMITDEERLNPRAEEKSHARAPCDAPLVVASDLDAVALQVCTHCQLRTGEKENSREESLPVSCVTTLRCVALRWRTREKSRARGKYIPLSAVAKPRLLRTSIGSAVLITWAVGECTCVCGHHGEMIGLWLRILALPAGDQLLENQNRQFLILNSWRRKKK